MDIGDFRYDRLFAGAWYVKGKRSFADTGEFSSGIGGQVRLFKLQGMS
jgi:hypothetical protein